MNLKDIDHGIACGSVCQPALPTLKSRTNNKTTDLTYTQI